MTFVTQTHAHNSALKLALAEAVYKTLQRIEDYRAYRHTVAELANLNDAQLADMGLPRSEIKDTARTAVYGSEA